MILTLKDTSILKDADNINEDTDELESIRLREAETLKRNLELKKKKVTTLYNVHDDSEKSILSQYDDPKAIFLNA